MNLRRTKLQRYSDYCRQHLVPVWHFNPRREREVKSETRQWGRRPVRVVLDKKTRLGSSRWKRKGVDVPGGDSARKEGEREDLTPRSRSLGRRLAANRCSVSQA